MKKIINGKKYDTETAKCVGENYYGNHGDFRRWVEQLYQKQTGEFFLYGEGGPRSQYAKCFDDGSIGYGEGIIPLTIDVARAWAEEYLDCDSYEAIFGEVSE